MILQPPFRVSSFVVDVSPPMGHTLMGSFTLELSSQIVDPLFCHGVAIQGIGDPIVLAVFDWCGIGNRSYDAIRADLAQAAGTTTSRVVVTTVHQHDAPVVDEEMERLFSEHDAERHVLNMEFYHDVRKRVATAVRDSLQTSRPVTHIGTGQARVERVASNRRILGKDGKVEIIRFSRCVDPVARAAPEGLIDPNLKTISFWNGESAVASISCYATHPMSSYGKGLVSADFPGDARRRRQADDPIAMHFYASGCAGNITAGKYNDGSNESRAALADRLYAGWTAAWKATKLNELKQISMRSVPHRFPARTDRGFLADEMRERLELHGQDASMRARAAVGLSWRARADSGSAIDIPAIDFGPATIIALPGEPFIEYQLFAQQQRPESLVMTLGYADYGPGYLPTDCAYEQGGYEPSVYCFVGCGLEEPLKAAIAEALAI